MHRVLRAPLLHFLLVGGVILGLRMRWNPGDTAAPRPRIAIGPADLGRLREAWTEEHGAPPGPVAEEALVRAAIDEEVLYREALARGFDRQDAAVRERLVRLGGFVGEEAGGDRDALERQARRLGLERSDLVIRRHLVEMMRLAAAWGGEEDLPSEAELEAYLARHADEFAQPARVRLTQVCLSDARGDAARADAGALLDGLRGSGSEAGAGHGDAFIGGREFDGSRAELARVFGAGFAEAVDATPLRSWAGPVRSSYGWHLLWVHTREAARLPALAEVQGRVLHRWLREKREERQRDAMDALRARYAIDAAR